jgi:hypothetical protein
MLNHIGYFQSMHCDSVPALPDSLGAAWRRVFPAGGYCGAQVTLRRRKLHQLRKIIARPVTAQNGRAKSAAAHPELVEGGLSVAGGVRVSSFDRFRMSDVLFATTKIWGAGPQALPAGGAL